MESLTWAQCLQEASAHNQDLLAAVQSVKSADNSHLASLGQFLPQVNFNGSIGRSRPDNSLDGAFSDPNFSQNANLSLSASENIFSGFKDFARGYSNALLDLAKAQLDQTKSQLSHDLKTAFYQLLFAQQQIDLLQQIVDRDKANQDLVQMNFDGGTDNKGYLATGPSRHRPGPIHRLEQAQRALRVHQKQLDQVLGRDPMGEILVQGDFDVPTLGFRHPEFAEFTLQTPAHRCSLSLNYIPFGKPIHSDARGAFLPTLSPTALPLPAEADITLGGAQQHRLVRRFFPQLPVFSRRQGLLQLQRAPRNPRKARRTTSRART